jgi:hypothetical protein
LPTAIGLGRSEGTNVEALLCAIALAPVTARAAEENRGFLIDLQGGGYTPVSDIDEAGSAQFETGFLVGGDVAYRFNRYLAVRGSFNFARTEADAPRYVIDATNFDRLLSAADLQLRHPTGSGAERAAASYQLLLAKRPEAYADHVAAFFMGIGNRPQLAVELARKNSKLRDTPRSRRLLASALRNAEQVSVTKGCAA